MTCRYLSFRQWEQGTGLLNYPTNLVRKARLATIFLLFLAGSQTVAFQKVFRGVEWFFGILLKYFVLLLLLLSSLSFFF